jgi:hypothetical protein
MPESKLPPSLSRNSLGDTGSNESNDDVVQPGASTRTQLIAGQHGCDTAKKREGGMAQRGEV